LRSHKSAFAWLLEKEWRDLLVSRSWWVLLLVMGPLVGVSFTSAIRTYTEVSGLSGTAADAGEVLSPLIGVWAPTFSACELAAVFLLPFLAIHLVAGDRQSGALKLELQQGMSPVFRIAAKAIVALAGWLIAMLPPFSAVLLWRFYGGSVYGPEMAALIAGHVLNAGLTIALGSATASLTEHPSTAAILTLAVTVSTWIVNFFGAIQGGWWERAAGYTPAAMVGAFQHGLVRLDTTLVAVALILTGLGVAAIWMRLGVAVKRRVYESGVAVLLLAAAIFACTRIPASQSWDWSESRGNSFSEADELALKEIHTPLRVEVHLAPEDPRRVDLDHRALSKLRRVMPNLQVNYEAATSTGLFEQTSAGYGEIWYYLGGRRTMSRVTTAEGVLETVYSLAGVAPPKEDEEAVFRGHPLAMPLRPALAIFYGFWPGLFLAGGILLRKRLN
jgi:ABC-type transport system involved in multi-copper enzyme maturation permease subunit